MANDVQEQSVEIALTRHLTDIEAAVRHVVDELDPVLYREIGKTVEARTKKLGWAGNIDVGKASFWLAPNGWLTPAEHRGNFDEDAWFEMLPIYGVEGKVDATDLAAFVGASANGHRMALHFGQYVATPRPFRAVLAANPELLEEIRILGFEIEQRAGRIAYPLMLDPEILGRAFVDNVFDEALAPLEEALGAATAAAPIFDKLVAQLREKRGSA